jgi:hypothetical protein
MTITPDKVLRTDMTKNLTPDEAVAVNDLGHVLSRADRATIESAYPGHAIFGAADFAALDGVALTSIEHPETGAPFDENADLNPASLETVEIEVAEEPKAEEAPAKDPLDHDGDGVSGGSEAGENSTAAKGARNRKAKSAS